MHATFRGLASLSWRRHVLAVTSMILAALSLSGCSDDGDPAGPNDASPGVDSGPEALDSGTGATLTGTVKDKGGIVVSGAKVELGTVSVFSDTQGKYTLTGLPTGAASVKVTRDWFKPFEQSVTVAAGTTTADLTVEEMPLKIEPADQALATSYGMTFDWTKQAVSVAVAARPTRRAFDNAVFFHNPALYRDTAGTPALSPSPAPEISGKVGKNFSFPLQGGPRQGQESLELTTIADTLADTPLGAQEPAEFMMWTPMVNWLAEWDAAKAADLRLVGTAVRQQNWGGNAIRPQDLEKVYFDPGGAALWVKVVFAGFVQLGQGINDDDGDGAREIYAKVSAAQVSAEVIAKLRDEYGKTVFNTHGLSKEVTKSLNELYSTTAAQVERYIGQPFELPGAGTITYPFVVLRHAGGKKNVILVAPGP
jgi:hypothetical protein